MVKAMRPGNTPYNCDRPDACVERRLYQVDCIVEYQPCFMLNSKGN